MPTPYDLRRQLQQAAIKKLNPDSDEAFEAVDDLVDVIMFEVQQFVLAKLGLAR